GLADCDGDPDNGCETDVSATMVAECDGDPSTLCETHLLTDKEHCGSCERSCLGGDCKAGMCAVEQVQNGNGAFEFVLKDGNIYFSSSFGTGISMAPLSGGAPKKIAETPAPGEMIRLYKDVLYFSTETQIMSVPIAGGTPVEIVGNVAPFIRMAVGGGKVY